MARPAANKKTKPPSKAPNAAANQFSTSFLGEWAGPPPGTYDPGIRYDVESGRVGLQQLLEDLDRETKRGTQESEQKAREIRRQLTNQLSDIGKARGYAETDTGQRYSDLDTAHGRRLGALGINFSRDIEDLSRARLRGEEDYGRTLTDLQHRYGSVAEQQNQAFVQQGTNETGTETASAAVRGANQAYDKSGIDLSHLRGVQDLDTREGRTREDYGRRLGEENTDYGTNRGRIGEDLTRRLAAFAQEGHRDTAAAMTGLHALDRAHNRVQQDREIKESRAKGEEFRYERGQSLRAYYEAHQLHPKIQFPAGAPPGAPPVPSFLRPPGYNPTVIGGPGGPKALGAHAFAHPQKYRRASLGY